MRLKDRKQKKFVTTEKKRVPISRRTSSLKKTATPKGKRKVGDVIVF